MGVVEAFSFDRGIVLKRKPLLLEDGELISSSGFNYNHDGVMEPRSAKEAVNSTAYNEIHSIHRYINWVVIGDAGNVRYKWDLDGYCDLYVPPDGEFTLLGTLGSSNPLRMSDYGEFTFMVNGTDAKAFLNTNLYDWKIPNPTITPIGSQASSGSLSGVYTLYYTFYIIFPNGRAVETGPSPAGTTASLSASSKINWSSIGICPYSGTDLLIYRRLYRTSDTLIETYLVDTITNNTATTYTGDNVIDATLDDHSALSTSDYGPPPDLAVDVTNYLQRMFVIEGNTLWPSEPYLPFTFISTEAIDIISEGIDLIGIMAWGDQLYMCTASAWYRLQGSSASTWQIRNTFAEVGCINRRTMKKTRYGILGLWYDGLYLFDGSMSKNITKDRINTAYFTDIASIKNCYAEWDGQRYYFYYPSTGTTPNKCLIADFTYYPEIRFFNDDFIATAFEYHVPTGIKYCGKADGKQYKDGTTETRAVSLQTGDRAVKDIGILKMKQTEYLYYDIDTNSEDVTITLYADGTAQSPTITLNTSSRERKRVILPSFQGYRFSMAISCSNADGVSIYEPWGISFNPYGD